MIYPFGESGDSLPNHLTHEVTVLRGGVIVDGQDYWPNFCKTAWGKIRATTVTKV